MEDRLKGLIEANNETNRTKWAMEWQKQGKKVIGVLSSYVPEEIIYAAGMLPWRIQGTWREGISLATMYRPSKSCTFLNHVLESILRGEMDFLDGVIWSNRDQDFMRLWDIWESLGKIPFIYYLDIPVMNSKFTQQRFAGEIRDLISAIEGYGKIKIDDDLLRNAIAVYNHGRTLLRRVYELRKMEVPPLSGGEALAIATASTVMPRDEFNKKLEELLPFLEKRKTKVKHTIPRLLLTSDLLDNPAYIDLVEKAGCLVAMDDMDTGSRYFWEMVDDSSTDPIDALAERYLKNRSPHMLDWHEQAEQLIQWVYEFRIDGVLDLPDMFDHPRGYRRLFFENRIKQAGIPEMSFERDYCLTGSGQLSTRVQAFLEILETR